MQPLSTIVHNRDPLLLLLRSVSSNSHTSIPLLCNPCADMVGSASERAERFLRTELGSGLEQMAIEAFNRDRDVISRSTVSTTTARYPAARPPALSSHLSLSCPPLSSSHQATSGAVWPGLLQAGLWFARGGDRGFQLRKHFEGIRSSPGGTREVPGGFPGLLGLQEGRTGFRVLIVGVMSRGRCRQGVSRPQTGQTPYP